MHSMASAWVIIFLTGMLGIWKAVPVGFALGSDPLVVWTCTVLGAFLSVLILYFFGNRIRDYLDKRRKKKRKHKRKTKKQDRVQRLFDKYGAAGLGLLGCLLMGPNATMLLGMIVVKSPRKLLFYTSLGILIWTGVLSLLAVFSMDLFLRITGSANEPSVHSIPIFRFTLFVNS